MAKVTWDQVEKRDDYKALPLEEKKKLKAEYLKREIEPTPQYKSLKPEQRNALRSNFIAGKYENKPAPKKKAPIAPLPQRDSLPKVAGTAFKEAFDNNVTGAMANKAVREGMAAIPQAAKPLAQQWTERQQRQIDARNLVAPKPMTEQLRDDLNAAGEAASQTAVGLYQNLSTGSEGLGEGLTAWVASMGGSVADPAAFGIAKGAGTLANKAIAKGMSPTLAHGAAALTSGGIQGGATSLAQGDYANAGKNALLGALLEGATSINGAPAPKPAAPARPPRTLNRGALRMPDPDLTAARRDGAVAVARARKQAAPAPMHTLNPRASEKQPPMRPLHPGHRVGPAPVPRDTINPAQADPFPALEFIEGINAQAERQGAPVTNAPTGLPGALDLDTPASVQQGAKVTTADGNRPMYEGKASAADLKFNASDYQFKAALTDTGATDRLMGVESWDAAASSINPVIVHQRKDGSLYVVDGHQRVNLAKRLQGEGKPVPPLNVRILREADGWGVKQARNYGAKLNIQQGTGTAIDTAKVIRDKGLTDTDMKQMPQKGKHADAFNQGKEIAKLGNEAFYLAINMMPTDPDKAAMVASIVGQKVKTPEIQAAILREFQREAPSGRQEASLMVDQLLADGFDSMTTEQLGLFGRDVVMKSNARDIAKMLVTLGNDIKADKATTARLIRSEDRVTAIEGNTVNRDATAAALDDARQMEQALALLGVTDQEFRNQLTAIAKSGATRKDALTQARAALQGALDRKQAVQAQPVAPGAPVEAIIPQSAPVNQTAAGIQSGFQALGSAAKEAGEARAMEIVAQQGYVGFKKPEAAALFRKDHPTWTEATIAGESRFYPPDASDAGGIDSPAAITDAPPVSSDQVSMFGNDPMLRLIADESGELDLGALGNKAGQAITYLRGVFQKLVRGEEVDTEAAGRAVLAVTRAEMPEARAEAIRAQAKVRAQAIKDAARARQQAANQPAPDHVPPPAPVEVTPAAQAAEAPAPVAPVAEVAPALTQEAPIAPEAPRAPVNTAGINPDQYLNVGKLNLSDETAHRIRQLVAEDVAENGRTKTPIPHQAYVDAARQMGMDPSMLRVPGPGETITPTLHAKLKMELKGIGERITAQEAEINARWGAAPMEEIAAARAALDSLEMDAKAIMDVLIPARSQDGRNLAFHRWMAESSFDEAYWVGRARRQAGNAPDVAIPREARFASTVRRGALAQARMQEIIAELEARGIRDHGIDPNDPDIDGLAPPRRNAMNEFLREEGGFLDLNRIGEWAMGLNTRNHRPGPDARHRLRTHAIADPEVRRLMTEGLTAAAEVRAARIEMAATLATLQRTPRLAVLSAARKVGLLVNPGTMTINLAGGFAGVTAEGISKVPAMFADPLVGWVFGEAGASGKARTGRRTVDVNLRSIQQASRRAATKGIRDAVQVMRFGMTREQLARMDMPREINSGNGVLDLVLNVGFRTASAPDRIFFNYAQEVSLREQARLYARNERGGRTPGWDLNARAEEIYDAILHPAGPNGSVIPDDLRTAMTTRATDDALYATFANETVIGNTLQGIPGVVSMSRNPAIRATRPAVEFLYDQIVTFKAIPGAVATRALDYSLVGLGGRALWHLGNGDAARVWRDGLTYGEQRAISMALGRGATGFGLMMIGLALGERGWIEGAYDRETKDINEAAGRIPSSIKIKFPWMEKAHFVPVGQLAPQGTMLVVGAMLRDLRTDPAKVGWAALKTVADSPMTSGIKTAAQAWEDEEGVAKFLAQWSGSWVPSVVGQTAKALDPSRAEVEIRKDHALQDGIQARLPFARNTMPRKSDILGQPVEAPTGAAAFWRFNGREAREDDSPMLQALIAANRELPPGEKVRITRPGHNLTINKVKIAMPPEVAREYDALVGQMVAERLALVTAHPRYQEADATTRKGFIDEQEAKVKDAVIAAIKGQAEASGPVAAFLQKNGAALRDAYMKSREGVTP